MGIFKILYLNIIIKIMTKKNKCVTKKNILTNKDDEIEYCCFECFLQKNYCGFINTSTEKYLRKYVTKNLVNSHALILKNKNNKELESIQESLFSSNNKKYVKNSLIKKSILNEGDIDILIYNIHHDPVELKKLFKKSNIISKDLFELIDSKILSLDSSNFLKDIDNYLIKIFQKINYSNIEKITYIYKHYFEYLEEKYENLKKNIDQEKIYFVKTFMKKIYYQNTKQNIDVFFMKDIISSLEYFKEEEEYLFKKVEYFNKFIDYWHNLHIKNKYMSDNHETMLHDACKNNEMFLVKVIIYSGINIDIKDKHDYSAYQYLSSGTYSLYKKILCEYIFDKKIESV